ncbi:phytoene/squalene synthase family protein [Bacillus shivajii]|uniref:squalene/phytoene synthase family protein n=1 Tax=Bacillus shivajii TaxID=1983719 RepID=UPI001CFAA93F|nr:phytoene/squalene synthase family protein [Bacillus shivajii]UCZ53584.1 phytoene/squalene synthase family protein [Bacillus shivajii]
MSETSHLHNEAIEMLRDTSRTFFIPITHLPERLKEAVTGAYLCMRAIDEVEDHPELPADDKVKLLRSISETLQGESYKDELAAIFKNYKHILPEVSLRLHDWITVCPKEALRNVLDSTSTMADGMASWVEKNFDIQTKKDLDDYTYYVAGLVGVMLSDLWKWYDNIETDKELAIAFGRGLQSVNILRNRDEDLDRDEVDFFPNGWGWDEMFRYARKNLAMADQYMESINNEKIQHFCQIPLALAHATLDAIAEGKEKISRTEVHDIVNKVVNE